MSCLGATCTCNPPPLCTTSPAYPPHTCNAPAAAAMAATFANPEPCLPRGSLLEDLKQNLEHDTNFEATTNEALMTFPSSLRRSAFLLLDFPRKTLFFCERSEQNKKCVIMRMAILAGEESMSLEMIKDTCNWCNVT